MRNDVCPNFLEQHERVIVWLFCLAAAVHVFVFSAAFPLFNNVDEPMHFDLVVKYSQNGVPRALDPLSPESLRYIVLFSTSAYFENPANLPDGKFPAPPWTQPVEKIRQMLLAEEKVGGKLLNYEASQPPLYYELAAQWWRLGKWCGIHDGFLPYWIRFLNILFMLALVWLGFTAAKIIFHENSFLRLAVPALLAFIPQTAFYSISNDMLSPLCFGAVFICLAKFALAETPDVRLGIFTGLALAATFLAKMTNVPMLIVSAGFILLKIWGLAKNQKLKLFTPSLAALFLCAGLPAAIWAVWCKTVYGDLTGSEIKAAAFGWTHQPFIEWWSNPVFTSRGFWTFWSGNLETFWQGEFFWHGAPLAFAAVNLVYVILSMAVVGVALACLRPQFTTGSQRLALGFGFLCFAAGILFLVYASVSFDFHDSFNPSRARPFFVAGRMFLGALIPFLLLFAFGLDCVMKKTGNATKFSVLAAIIFFMLIAEIAIDWPIFSNPYNWFHM